MSDFTEVEMPMVALIAVLALAFLIRFLPRLRRRDAIVSDTYFHLYCAELIRSSRFRIPLRLPSVILNHKYTYPFGYHLFLALFPKNIRGWAEMSTGAAFDTANTVMVFAATNWFLRRAGVEGPWIPMAAAFLYAVSPALLRVGSGPRSYNGSARIPGQSLYLAHILSAYLAWTTGNLAWAGVSVLAGAVLLFTATFSFQVFFFFGVSFGFLVSPLYFLMMMASVLASMILTAGMTVSVLQGRIAHSTLYFTHLQKIFLYPHIVPFSRYLGSAGKAITRLVRGDRQAFLEWFFHERYFLHLLLTTFPQIALLVCLAPGKGFHHQDARFLLIWVMNGVLWFFLTRWRPMLFLGESERYLESVMLPSLTLFTLGAREQAPWLLWAVMAYFALAAIYLVRDYLRKFLVSHLDYSESEAVFQQLRKLPPGRVMPVGWVHWQAIQRGTNPVLTIGGLVDTKLLPLDEFLLVYGNYPYPGSDFRGIADRYGIAYLLAERSCLEDYLDHLVMDATRFWDDFMVLRQTPTLILLARKRPLAELASETAEAIRSDDIPRARPGLDTLIQFLPGSQQLVQARDGMTDLGRRPTGPTPVDPFNLDQLFACGRALLVELRYFSLLDRMVADGHREIIVCGAGRAAPSLLGLACQKGLTVRCLTDRTAGGPMKRLLGIPIRSLEEGVSQELPCLIGTPAFAREIEDEIKATAKHLGRPEPPIYAPGG
jgi:hypothetical protein